MGAVIARRIAIAVMALALGLGTAIGPVFEEAAAASDNVSFGTPTTVSDYCTRIVFHQPVDLATVPSRVEILIDYPTALGPNVTEVHAPTASGSQTLSYAIEIGDIHVLPNTPLTARWRLTFGSTVVTGPDVSLLYADTGFKWQTLSGPLVRIHWYDGDAAFGRRALAIAEAGVRKAETMLGVTETEPIDFFVYAAQVPFYAALGPGTPENVGGEEHSEIRTMFALITPDEVDASWVAEVLPHELSHLVFNTAVDNPYHFPPRWLNEGLAVYLSRGYVSDDRTQVAGAAQNGSLTPLDGLTGDFPANRDRFFLAYAESVSAVDYLVRTYGQPALVSLIRSYSKGVTDDEAFKAALGVDTTAFTAGWLADVKAKTPVSIGPKPAPAGPLPEAWGGSGLGEVASTTDGGGGTTAVLLALGGVTLIVVVGAVFLVRRQSQPGAGEGLS